MPRIVSLLASSTEIVAALGFEEQLVGRSHECDHPEWVRRLPACTEPKFDPDGASCEIDGRVKAILEEGLSVYRVHADTLRDLRPDIILTQTQCEVCAVSLEDVEAALENWVGSRPRIVSLEPGRLSHVWDDFLRVAEALGDPDAGDRLVARSKARMHAISERTRSLKARPRVACIEWIEPLMAAGNWMPELVEMAGGFNLFGEAGKHSPGMSATELRDRDPDVIFVSPCGLDLPRIRREMPALERMEGWSLLGAVRAGRVILADGNAYFNRPGPRLVDSLEILAEVLHPDAFHFGYEGRGWQRHGKPSLG